MTWHDARVHRLPPGVDRGRWAIPVLVDGRRAQLAGGLLGLLALAVGLTDLPVFPHGVVLSAAPSDVMRLFVALAISAGAAAVVVGLFVFLDVLEHYEERGPVPG